jgi:steroid 5-alpha reductase family enzyme
MQDAVAVSLQGLVAAAGLMTVVWLVSLVKRDAGIIDIFWGPTFALLGWVYWAAGGDGTARQLLVPVLVTIWALRLAIYILWRSRGGGEDYRYAAMRRKYGRAFAPLSLVIVFWLQALLAWLIGMPLLQVQRAAAPAGLGWLDLLGLALFAVGLYFEAVGDYQLARFKANPENRGKVMDRGLWRYTRHPNYFGDAALWWGLACFALATPGSAWTLFSPVLMTFLLLKVSGVALLEKGLSSTKPGYEEYVRRTSAFLPRPPRD